MGGCRATFNLPSPLLLLQLFFALVVLTGCTCARTFPTPNAQQQNSDTQELLLPSKTSIPSNEKDVTTPVTTVPTPSSPLSSTPITNPMINPNSDPDSSTSPPTNTTTPTVTPATVIPSASAGASWCVAVQNAPPKALQLALDFACGYGRADCNPIQPGGSCYYPDTLRSHASFAFNSYYQKNPIPSSCNFGGTAVTTSTDPSTGSCRYPSTSTSSSVLNTTNSNGATVFGAVPSTPSLPSEAAKIDSIPYFMSISFLIMFFPYSTTYF